MKNPGIATWVAKRKKKKRRCACANQEGRKTMLLMKNHPNELSKIKSFDKKKKKKLDE